MVGNEGGGGDPLAPGTKRGRTVDSDNNSGEVGEDILYLPYYKPDYKRLYPENSVSTEYKVFVESSTNERLGNKSPIYLNHIFSNGIKGVVAIRRINASKIVVIFKQFNTANNFINNTAFLEKNGMRAFIPAAHIEKTGIIRFVPVNISNKDLYSKLSSIYEIISVRRFTKKVGQGRVPLQTVSITFLSNSLPDNVQYDLFSYRVFDYIPPLQQCYRCFKFNHSAKICSGKQRCSCCAGDHHYKECDKPNELSCVNCSGPHMAISRTCPIKIQKMMEKKSKITYSSIVNTKNVVDFPPLKTTQQTVQNVNLNVNKPLYTTVNKTQNQTKVTSVADVKSQLLGNNDLTMAIVRTLIQLANNADDTPITTTTIKEMLFKNLS